MENLLVYLQGIVNYLSLLNINVTTHPYEKTKNHLTAFSMKKITYFTPL